MALKALVTVVTMVDGVRKEFQPGEELPELHAHDKAALLAAGAIEDTAEAERSARAKAAAEKKAGKEFAAAKAAVQAANESVAVDPVDAAAGEAKTAAGDSADASAAAANNA